MRVTLGRRRMSHPGTQPASTNLADRWLRSVVDRCGGRLAGRYRPVHVLAQGGMGVVLHAIDERLQRDVAIKLLRPEFAGDPGFVERFSAEARALSRLHHPNVVQIIDVSEIDPATPLYVMEFVPGVTLSRRLRQRGRMPWAEAFEVLQQLAGALAAIHRAGIVHRDIKPSNIICLDLDDDRLHIKLIDFGIALHGGAPRLTAPGEMIGTVAYMAPEQFAGLALDARTDVYAWGVLALEVAAGASPAELSGDEELWGSPLREAAVTLLDEARIPQGVAGVIRRCLAARAEDRFTDMAEVARTLKALDNGGAPTLTFQRDDAAIWTPEAADGAVAAASTSIEATTADAVGESQTQVAPHVPRDVLANAKGSSAAGRPRSTMGEVFAVTMLATILVGGAALLGYQHFTRLPTPVRSGAFAGLPAAVTAAIDPARGVQPPASLTAPATPLPQPKSAPRNSP